MRKKEMKIKVKNIMIVTIMMIMMIIGKENYSKASSFSFDAQADKTEVSPGEEVAVEMNVSDIDMGEYGINVVEGILEYDESFFLSMELINQNGWKITYNDEEGERKGKFLTAKMTEGVKIEETIGKIKLKVREDITEGESQLKIKTIQSNDGVNVIDEGERIITIRIKKVEENLDETDEPNASHEPQVKPENNEDKETNMPQENVKTGDNIVVVIGIIAGVVVLNVVVVLIKRNKDKEIDNKNK